MKGKLHIIFLSGWYPSRVFPYNGDFIQRHAEAVSLLHRVTVIHVVTDKKLNKNIEISDTEINGIRTLIAYIRHSVFKPFLFFKAFRKLLNMAGNYDLVHTNILYPIGLVSLFIKLIAGKKYIITEHHTIYHKELRGQIGTFRRFVSGLISKNAAAICPVSKHLSCEMKDFGLEGNYIEVPNVVDTELFAAKGNRNNERFSVIHVSNMESRKRVTDIMDIIKDLQNKIGRLSFYLIGENSHKYIDYARDIGIDPENIEFLDQITHQQLVSYYQKSDVFILFSESENLPCVILESFSCGTPVISNNVGGIAEYFPKDFGFLENDKSNIIPLLLKIHAGYKFADPEVMHNYAVKHFSQKSIAEKFSEIYFDMLEN